MIGLSHGRRKLWRAGTPNFWTSQTPKSRSSEKMTLDTHSRAVQANSCDPYIFCTCCLNSPCCESMYSEITFSRESDFSHSIMDITFSWWDGGYLILLMSFYRVNDLHNWLQSTYTPKYIYTGVHTLQSTYTSEYIHSGVHTLQSTYTPEYTYCGLCIHWSTHTMECACSSIHIL